METRLYFAVIFSFRLIFFSYHRHHFLIIIFYHYRLFLYFSQSKLLSI